jgi:hypothetical protein
VTFIADPDGISNLYRIPIDGGPIVRLTSFSTGVAGMTSSSPAFSTSAGGERMVFNVFEDGGHAVYVLEERQTVQLVAPSANTRAAVLPGRDVPTGDVYGLLTDSARGLPAVQPANQPSERYKGGLSLDAIGQPTVSAGVSEFGGYVAGGMSAMFSDMLGDRMLGVAGQIGGTLDDLGGELIYINRRRRWNWAATVQALPYRTGYMTLDQDPVTGRAFLTEVIERQSSRGAFGMATYPFSTATRFEGSVGARALSYSRQSRVKVYDSATGNLLERLDPITVRSEPLYLSESHAAIVRDTSFFGATSPIFGERARMEFAQSIGTLKYSTITADYRRYFMPATPFTIAVRGMHFGRYGRDAEDIRIAELYLGYPEFVRGYGLESFDAFDCVDRDAGGKCAVFNNLRGSRLMVANIELRAPLLGLFERDLVYGRVPVEVAAFFDAGVAWTSAQRPDFMGGTREVVKSAGGLARVNLLGFLVVEISAARPFNRAAHGWQWQVGVKQGF